MQKPLLAYLVVVLLMPGMLTLVAGEVNAQASDPYFKQAIQEHRSGNYQQAIFYLNKYISLHDVGFLKRLFGGDDQKMNQLASAYYYRGQSKMKAGFYKEALGDLKKASRYGQDFAAAYNAVGHALNELGRYEEAIGWFKDALDINPTMAVTYNNLGNSYLNLEKFREAISNFNQAIRLDSTFALAYNNRGAARYYNQDVAKAHENDIKRAIKDFSKALKYDSTLILAQRNRGIGWRMLDEYE
ncbi:MAG: hypothetical protein BRD50_06400, partial [Bacteroidetes bacterium SW_11_45_7]